MGGGTDGIEHIIFMGQSERQRQLPVCQLGRWFELQLGRQRSWRELAVARAREQLHSFSSYF